MYTQEPFQIRDLQGSDVASMRAHKVWNGGPPVAPERLKHLTLSYWDFEGRSYTDGVMIVLDQLADGVIEIFQALYEVEFPFHSIRLMDDFEGNDRLSMAANNTSCFNNRLIATGERKGLASLHAYGAAIDINPRQNPNITRNNAGEWIIEPTECKGADLCRLSGLRRDRQVQAGYAEPLRDIFAAYGFTEWGGDFPDKLDYQHFQVPRARVMEMVSG